MDFSINRPARRPRENIVPMINVVFLLLIFFLMTAQIAPPAPYDIAPPEARAAPPPEPAPALYLAPGQPPAHGALRGDAALAAAAQGAAAPVIRVDAAFPAADLARVLARLTELGAGKAVIVTGARR